MRRRDYRRGLRLLLVPYVLGATLLVVLPALASFAFAFTRFDGIGSPRWDGLDVFRDLFVSPEFHDSVRATAVVAAIAVPLRVVGAVAFALLLHRRSERLAASGRVAAFAPVVVPDAATALVWLWVVNPVYGPLGIAARALGFDAGPLLLDPWRARGVVIAISALALGEGFLVVLAARRELPSAVYDVARLEGAGAWQTFRRVTLPLLLPVLAFLVVRDTVASVQVPLVPTLVLTEGGPLNATKTLPVLVYEKGFAELRFGDAAAVAMLMFALALAVAAVQLLFLRRRLRWSAK
ncbi:MAG TPA: sugar ABC transporter permease [Frankiaceae bacterium]|nr:sugar ABC transporter permease [Frankiaceae bacterium]